ncbi:MULTISPECIES: hypothetical protein [Bacteria]|uniref:hypothetical protein n=1 Tax=Bacteria TaxID=2 RepID=UPI0005C1B317|nr:MULTISPECIES: hypothetical protein [Bacteria]KIV34463.1 hypothetical protein TR09_17400 [Vibrio parahaemolyticus]MED3865401.1 hypothetical protein [Priestia megaterium]
MVMEIVKVYRIKVREMKIGVIYENLKYDGSGKSWRYALKDEDRYLQVSNDLKYWTQVNRGKV